MKVPLTPGGRSVPVKLSHLETMQQTVYPDYYIQRVLQLQNTGEMDILIDQMEVQQTGRALELVGQPPRLLHGHRNVYVLLRVYP